MDTVSAVPSLLDLTRHRATDLIHTNHLPPVQDLRIPNSLKM